MEFNRDTTITHPHHAADVELLAALGFYTVPNARGLGEHAGPFLLLVLVQVRVALCWYTRVRGVLPLSVHFLRLRSLWPRGARVFLLAPFILSEDCLCQGYPLRPRPLGIVIVIAG